MTDHRPHTVRGTRAQAAYLTRCAGLTGSAPRRPGVWRRHHRHLGAVWCASSAPGDTQCTTRRAPPPTVRTRCASALRRGTQRPGAQPPARRAQCHAGRRVRSCGAVNAVASFIVLLLRLPARPAARRACRTRRPLHALDGPAANATRSPPDKALPSPHHERRWNASPSPWPPTILAASPPESASS